MGGQEAAQESVQLDCFGRDLGRARHLDSRVTDRASILRPLVLQPPPEAWWSSKEQGLCSGNLWGC